MVENMCWRSTFFGYFEAENNPKLGIPVQKKVSNQVQSLPEHLKKNFEKAEKMIFLTATLVKSDL